MGALVRPTPQMLQKELCKRGVHTKKKAVESEIARRFPGGRLDGVGGVEDGRHAAVVGVSVSAIVVWTESR